LFYSLVIVKLSTQTVILLILLISVITAPPLSTTNNCVMPRVSVKSLSLTERLRYEFGVDASDETDDQPDGKDDGKTCLGL